MDKIDIVIPSRERDLGGFTVRRVLPCATHKMVGPFIFFDHMGPAEFPVDHGVDVRPHPHINLATVTYLFEGQIQHRDSLGSDQLIEPGAINWMTAGQGIVHSERTPEALRRTGSKLNGIQCWVALPDQYEEVPPEFKHYASEALPEFYENRVVLKLLLGKAFGHESPVKLYSDLFYLNARFPIGATLSLPADQREHAAYIINGRVRVNNQTVEAHSMAVGRTACSLVIEALEETHLMLLGGSPLGDRYIYWNFVASSKEKIEQAKRDWERGPGSSKSRFPKIPGDDQEYIPLPVEEDGTPKGTIM